MQTADKEEEEENMGLKPKADPVYFISLVSVERNGKVEDHEHIFDIYTKLYDFKDHDVIVKSAQDLWDEFAKRNPGSDKQGVNIYQLVEDFVQHNRRAHYVLDECPFLSNKDRERSFFTCKCRIYY